MFHDSQSLQSTSCRNSLGINHVTASCVPLNDVKASGVITASPNGINARHSQIVVASCQSVNHLSILGVGPVDDMVGLSLSHALHEELNLVQSCLSPTIGFRVQQERIDVRSCFENLNKLPVLGCTPYSTGRPSVDTPCPNRRELNHFTRNIGKAVVGHKIRSVNVNLVNLG